MQKIIKNLILIIALFFLANCDQQNVKSNNTNGIIVVKVFSSLTCPHCADFFEKNYDQLEKDFISSGKVKFEHHSFPLDLAALNAEKILLCKDGNIDYKFLSEIFKRQNKWAVGSDIIAINKLIKSIGKEFGLQDDQMDKCLADKNLEEKILTERINAQNNYGVKSTPTIFINEQKYEKSRDYKSFKKAIEKLL